MLLALQAALERSFIVDVARSAIQARRQALVNDYSGVVVDVEFASGESGLSLARWLRGRNAEMVIVVISAVAYGSDLRREAHALGAVFFEKPVRSDALLQVLAGFVGAESDEA